MRSCRRLLRRGVSGRILPGLRGSETNGTWGDAVVGNLPGSCVVPDVVGKALRPAKRQLKASQCRLAKVRSAYSKVKKGRVVAQQPKPGKILKRRGQRRAHSKQGPFPGDRASRPLVALLAEEPEANTMKPPTGTTTETRTIASSHPVFAPTITSEAYAHLH